MKGNPRPEGITEQFGPNLSAVASSSQNPFSMSVDLDWHHSPEGRGVLAHLIDQNNGLRKNYGKTCYKTLCVFLLFYYTITQYLIFYNIQIFNFYRFVRKAQYTSNH